ncbi:N-acetylglucosamine-6-phosphate deacetylase [uncultured Roseobacter sp.]|uniref:N-acetylglucosamine-6-phosphate deacetylase n=1 Tax=uncultured Roseobacter sp. TaxID=114847 RepID=UPI00262EA1A2|nr:N-acetylglucosamine-6-phosphate deacetylase [uncultured Roseobacter sp.]
MTRRAHVGAEIFDGDVLHDGKALLIDDGTVRGICSVSDLPEGYKVNEHDGGTLMPGFVDLQVNGGGGVMFNDETSLDGLSAIAEAHASTGTRALLPTLITDKADRTRLAVDAVEQAIAASVPGIIGLHLEGPHLSLERKGAHDPALIRKMETEDEDFLISAAARLPNLMVTVAPESVTIDQIARMAHAGVIVSLGHTDCRMDTAVAAFDAGARCVTHLFNAMSQIGNREPGLVGATLSAGGVFAGLVADDIHVHAETMRVALSAKKGPGEIFLVTDAMSTVGSRIAEFELNGRRVLRRDGRLTLEDGTLAGADLEMIRALRVVVGRVGVSKAQALRMATGAAAKCLRNPLCAGHLLGGPVSNVVHLHSDMARAEAL